VTHEAPIETPIDAPTYEFQQPGFWGSRRVRCVLGEGELRVDVEGKPPLHVPYQDVTTLHLSSRAHGRNEAVLSARDFRCRVITRGQGVEITNRSDPGVGRRYQYANQAFRSFVQELHRRLAPFHEHIQFRTGHRLTFWLTVAAVALTAVLGPFRLASYDDHLGFGIAVYLSAVIGLVVAARRLRPRSYAPTSIPEGLLPAADDHSGVLA
jgi:hypothetical protein